MDEYGPSLEDIRKCTHREKNPQKRQERECKCEPGNWLDAVFWSTLQNSWLY